MAVSIGDIDSRQWSTSIGEFGQVVENEEDIKQCIFLILTTVPGSLTFDPDFGCGLFEWIDEPINFGAPKMARDIRRAIATYEKRVTVNNVSYVFGDASVFFKIEVSPIYSSRPGSNREGKIFLGIEVEKGNIFLVDNFNRRIVTEFGTLVF